MIRIAQITDLHVDSEDDQLLSIDSRNRVLTIINEIKRLNTDLLVITGDLTELSGRDWLFSLLNELNIKYHISFGNHDDTSSFLEFPRFFCSKDLYYSFQIENFNVLILNSSSKIIDNEQVRWIKCNLSNDRRTIIFIHHPIIDCSQTTMDILFPLLNRDEVKSVFLSHKNEIVIFAGHYHHEYLNVAENITQHVTPSTTIQIKSDTKDIEFEKNYIGFRIIDIENSNYSTQVVKIHINNPTIPST